MKMKIKAGILLDTFTGARATNQEEGLMQLKQDRWILRQGGEEGVVMFGVRVGREAMETYSKGDTDQLGIDYNKIESFISSRDDMITMETEDMTLLLDDGRDTARIATIYPDDVKGAQRSVPSAEHEVVFKGEMSFITDFIDKIEGVVGSDWVIVCCRDDGMYLYSEHDNANLDRVYSWDDFEDVEFNWEVNNTDNSPEIVPKDDKESDTLLGIDFMKSLSSLGDEARFYFGNHVPCKMIWTPRDGVTMSYFVAPRIGGDNSRHRPPQSVIDG